MKDWDDLPEFICSKHWSPSAYKSARRAKDEFESISLLVLDVDDGCTLDEAQDHFRPFKYIIAPSRNHQKEKDKKPACDRFRVIIPLSREITDQNEYVATAQWALKMWPFIDKGVVIDPARFYFPCTEVLYKKDDGETVPVQEYDPAAALRDTNQPATLEADHFDTKGRLSHATKELLVFGAKSGTRNTRLFKATIDAIEQGYDEEEWGELLQGSSAVRDWIHKGKHQSTIRNTYRNGKPTLDKREFEDTTLESETLFLVDKDQAIADCISFLSDKEALSGSPRGLQGLDSIYGGGKRRGEIDVWVAEAKTGKNTLWHHMMAQELVVGRRPIGYASQEMKFTQGVLPAVLGNLLGCDIKELAKEGTLAEPTLERMRNTYTEIKDLIHPTYKTGQISLDKLFEWMEYVNGEFGVEDFYIDHLHMVSGKEKPEDIVKWINAVKNHILTHDYHLELIVQPRSRQRDRSGTMEKLTRHCIRGSVSIEQAVDGIIVMRKTGETHIRELEVEVHRNSLVTPGSVFVQYDKETLRFTDVEDPNGGDDPDGQDQQWGSRPNGRAHQNYEQRAARLHSPNVLGLE